MQTEIVNVGELNPGDVIELGYTLVILETVEHHRSGDRTLWYSNRSETGGYLAGTVIFAETAQVKRVVQCNP